MDKKLWLTGGEPNITADDVNRNSDANNRAFQEVLKAWLTGFNENFIISGCEITITPGVEASVTEGYIFLNGEILQVDAQTTAYGTLDKYSYIKEVTYDPAGQKVFIDGLTKDTWQKNRGKLIAAPSDPVPTNQLDASGPGWPAKVRAKIKGYFQLVTPGDYDFSEDWQLNYPRFDLSGPPALSTITISYPDNQVFEPDINFMFFY